MIFERRTDNRHDDSPKPPLQLVPKTTEEVVTFLLKACGDYPDRERIGTYLELLGDCTIDEIWQQVKVWCKQPHDRAANPGQLRDMILTARGHRAPVQTQEEQWEQERITPEEKQEVIAGLTPKARAFLREACPWLLKEE